MPDDRIPLLLEPPEVPVDFQIEPARPRGEFDPIAAAITGGSGLFSILAGVKPTSYTVATALANALLSMRPQHEPGLVGANVGAGLIDVLRLNPRANRFASQHPVAWSALQGLGAASGLYGGEAIGREVFGLNRRPVDPGEAQMMIAGPVAATFGIEQLKKMIRRFPAVSRIEFEKTLARTGLEPTPSFPKALAGIQRLAEFKFVARPEINELATKARISEMVNQHLDSRWTGIIPETVKSRIHDRVLSNIKQYISEKAALDNIYTAAVLQRRRLPAEEIDNMAKAISDYLSTGEGLAKTVDAIQALAEMAAKGGPGSEMVSEAVRSSVLSSIMAKMQKSKAGGIDPGSLSALKNAPDELWEFLGGSRENGKLLKGALEGLVEAEKIYSNSPLRMVVTPVGLFVAISTIGSMFRSDDPRVPGVIGGGLLVSYIAIPRILNALANRSTPLARWLHFISDPRRLDKSSNVAINLLAGVIADDIASGRAKFIDIDSETAAEILRQ